MPRRTPGAPKICNTRYRFGIASDEKLLQLVLEYRPFSATHGSKYLKWNCICAGLLDYELAKVSNAERAHQLTSRACRDRFQLLMREFPTRFGKYCTGPQQRVLDLIRQVETHQEKSWRSESVSTTSTASTTRSAADNSDHTMNNRSSLDFILNENHASNIRGSEDSQGRMMMVQQVEDRRSDTSHCSDRTSSSSTSSGSYSGEGFPITTTASCVVQPDIKEACTRTITKNQRTSKREEDRQVMLLAMKRIRHLQAMLDELNVLQSQNNSSKTIVVPPVVQTLSQRIECLHTMCSQYQQYQHRVVTS